MIKNLLNILTMLIDSFSRKKTEIKVVKEVKEDKEDIKIIPIYNEPTIILEDESDPEEELIVMPVVEKTPTSKHIYELINLIEKSIINRKITKIIFHCTATQQNTTVTSILKYWKETLGWQNPGYHIIITKDGSWTLLQDFNRLSNGVKGHNSNSINISYIGGIDKNGKPIDNRTEEQKEILNSCYFLFLNKIKDVKFHGHYEFTNKACPSFDVHNWIKELNK